MNILFLIFNRNSERNRIFVIGKIYKKCRTLFSKLTHYFIHYYILKCVQQNKVPPTYLFPIENGLVIRTPADAQ